MGGVRHEAAVVTLREELVRTGRIAGFGALTSTMLPAFLVRRSVVRQADRDRLRERWLGAWCAAMLHLFGVRVTVRGNLPPRGHGHLVVANHRSTADILLLLRTFGGRMVSRADLARWPLIGFGARVVGTVFVDRADAASGATAVRAMRSRLADGSPVIVFPEGTTFPDDEVRPFRPGGFVAALHAGADVVPVGIAYASGSGAQFVGESFPAHLARMAAAKTSRVVACIGPVLTPGEGERAASLRDRAHAEVQRLVREARRLVDG
jgi:1-acyl-sn-glycerol-3-phosphate acyltransferase